MRPLLQNFLRNLPVWGSIAVLAVVFGTAIALVSCGGTSTFRVTSLSGMGTINISITDPPSCKFPNGDFDHVYVTIRSVQANINATAGDADPGWVELVPALNTMPVQIDLFAAGPNACLLSLLGSNTALPSGTYQQIRLLLVANDGSTGAVPIVNACGNEGYNCLVLHSDGSIHELQLSSQANTGLKIPPGQVEGGPITVSPGQDVELNIDFNACASIIQEGNGTYHLKPVLTAGQVSTNNTGIDGQVVDSVTKAPIGGGTVLVALEQSNNNETDTIFVETAADSSGDFNFCPLPIGATFDVVVVAINGAGVAYDATVAENVSGGTDLGAIPLVAETGQPAGPGALQGFVTAQTGAGTTLAPATIDVSVSALQSVTVNGVTRQIVIPVEGASVAAITVQSNASCALTAPLKTNCAEYTLIVPASNPSAGAFSAGKISYSTPASGNVLYTVVASAFVSMGGGSTDCVPASQTTSIDSSGNPLKVTAGATTIAKEIDFSGCS